MTKNSTMTTETYIFDTYALFEIIEGNPLYEPYLDATLYINDFIFAELCYKLLREEKEHANYYIKKYAPHKKQLSAQTIKEAMAFRAKHKKQKLSMTDCISYFMAQDMGIKFLTGDKEFENMKNVEFVK